MIEATTYFELDGEELIKAKLRALILLNEMELELIEANWNLNEKENNLILNTNFKELGLNNEKMRNAHVNEQLRQFKQGIEIKKQQIKAKKYEIGIIKDLLKLRSE